MRELSHGPITLVYDLDRANEVVNILRILVAAD